MLSSSRIDSIKKFFGFEDFQINLKPEFSSSHPAYRGFINNSLMKDFDFLPAERVTEGVSISHCRDIGGYVWCQPSVPIGFDIEEASRIRHDVIERISSNDEHYPNDVLQWVAKEASFKAANIKFPIRVLSDVVVDGWQSLADDGHSFEFAIGGEVVGRGYAWLDDGHGFAVASLK